MTHDALKTQIGGDHYHKKKYQPLDLIIPLRMNFIQGSILKYVSRYKDKNGLEDLQKAYHYAEIGEETNPYTASNMDNLANTGGNRWLISQYAKDSGCSETLVMAIISQGWTVIKTEINKLIEEEAK